MMKKGLLLLCVIMLLSGCGMFKKKKKPPPPPEPTRVVLEFDAAGDINPNGEGRASPLVVRIYQLKFYSAFGKADFFSLYDNEEQALGRELIKKQEIVLEPNEKRTVFFETEDTTQTIGLLGVFMAYEGIQWKAAAGVKENKTAVIYVYISRAGLSVR
ncbi:type VI secretion system lipoprotein TssJ, partial [Desulfosarcina sp.]|uniref:type VI secretion system lipoprotein TssJ n=1 Tax=Desulfosarcina sp. TaxID=2027861 RepID=UPI003566054A